MAYITFKYCESLPFTPIKHIIVHRDFPGREVRTPHAFSAEGIGSTPSQGTKIS